MTERRVTCRKRESETADRSDAAAGGQPGTDADADADAEPCRGQLVVSSMPQEQVPGSAETKLQVHEPPQLQ